jgi:hypothetical protein
MKEEYRMENETKTVKVGSRVKVVALGEVYSIFESMASKMNLKHYHCTAPNSNDTYKVVSIKPHPEDSAELLAGLEDVNTGDNYIVGVIGLVVITQNEEHLSNLKEAMDIFVGLDESDYQDILKKILINTPAVFISAAKK